MNPWEQKRYNDAKNLYMNLPVEEAYAIFVGNAPTSPAKYAFWLGCAMFANPHFQERLLVMPGGKPVVNVSKNSRAITLK